MSSKELKVVGKSVSIHDVREKATGALRYVNDLKFAGMLHARLVLSPVAHAKVKAVRPDRALEVPGVVAVFSHENSPRKHYNSHKWIKGLKTIEDETLFTDEARYQGDRVAAVVAETPEAAEAAARLIEIEYEELPAVVDPDAALAEDSHPVHQGSRNLVFEKEMVCGDPDARMAGAPLVVEDRVETPRVHHAAMETHCCVATTDEFGLITVYTPCQVAFQVQLQVAEALAVAQDRVRVVKTTTGGSFGGKGQPILEMVTAFLSHSLKRPVKLLMDRTQTILASRTRHHCLIRTRTAVDRDGRILARDMHSLVDSGAYFTNGDAVAMAMGKKTFKLYQIKDQRYRCQTVYTNAPIGGACRGYGSPQICAATEINIDHTAHALGMDPLAFRLKNLVRAHDRDPLSGVDLGNARILECVRQGAEMIGWEAKYRRPRSAGRFARGIGMACAAHGNGYQGAFPDFINVSAKVDSDGAVLVKGAFHDLGCGTITTMEQIAAEVLELPMERVRATSADTLVVPFDSAGTQASRVTFVCGGAVKKVTEQLREKIRDFAAQMLGCPREEVVLEAGRAWRGSAPERPVSLAEIEVFGEEKLHASLEADLLYQSPGNPTSYGAHFAEVEVDRVTGRVRLLDYVAVHDIGQAINTGFVEGQLQGAIQMGIGMALTEEIALDGRGRVLTNRLSRYTLANAPEMPPIRVALIEDYEDMGPFGAKSIGEIATVPAAPAVINAVNDALGTCITHLPALPERIVAAVQALREEAAV